MTESPLQWQVSLSSYQRWIDSVERQQVARLPYLKDGPLISIVMPVYNPAPEFVRSAIDSVLCQDYRQWQLCIVDDASPSLELMDVLESYAEKDSRIRLVRLSDNAGVAAASNRGLRLAEGEFVALMDHDDVMPVHALRAVANEIAQRPEISFFYSDSDHLNESGERCNPFFKPQWDYYRFLGQNYLNHLTVIRRQVLQAVGGWAPGYQGSQDYDLYLRVIEHIDEQEIGHIPLVLYHWRDLPNSLARSNIAAAVKAARLAIEHHLERSSECKGQVTGAPLAIIYNRIQWQLPRPTPPALLLIHGEDAAQITRARESLVVGAEGFEPAVLVFDASTARGSLTSFINRSVQAHRSKSVFLVSAAVIGGEDDWLERLGAAALLPDVGLVGAKCITESGYLCGGPNFEAPQVELALAHTEPGLPIMGGASRGYIANLALDQTVNSLANGVIAIRTQLFLQLGGLDETRDFGSALSALGSAATAAGMKQLWLARPVFHISSGARASTAAPVAKEETRQTGAAGLDIAPLCGNASCRLVEFDIEWGEPRRPHGKRDAGTPS